MSSCSSLDYFAQVKRRGYGGKDLYDSREDMKIMHSPQKIYMLITYVIKGSSGADRKSFGPSLLESLLSLNAL